MLKLVTRFLDWIKSLFWKEEMELTLVGLQYSGKTTFVGVIAVSRTGSQQQVGLVVTSYNHHHQSRSPFYSLHQSTTFSYVE